MNKPEWLQDDLKIIRQWWSTKIMAAGFVFTAIGTGAAYSVSGVYFKEWLGRLTLPVCLILFACGAASQFVRQKKLRKTEPEKAAAMVQPDVPK